MIRIMYSPREGEYRTDLQVADLTAVLPQEEGWVWVDFEGETPEACEPVLRDVFNFHHLAVDDALNETHVPKIDDWQAYLYIVLRAVTYAMDRAEGIEIPELDIFIGKNYMVTHHDKALTAVDRVWIACQRDERLLTNGPDHLLYRLTDELISDAITVIEQIQDTLDEVEDLIFMSPSPQTAERIFHLKRDILRMRRVITPQREVLNKLARDNYDMIDPQDRVFFRDVYDHMMRSYELLDNLRDMTGSALDTYLSVVNNRMNDVMKTLAVFTALFMPLGFITGFFGMNFFAATINTELWSGWVSFEIAMVLMLAVPFSMVFWMHRRGWM